jgi:hypothetical protein
VGQSPLRERLDNVLFGRTIHALPKHRKPAPGPDRVGRSPLRERLDNVLFGWTIHALPKNRQPPPGPDRGGRSPLRDPAMIEILAGIRVIPAQPGPPDTAGNGVDQTIRTIGNQ